MFVTMPMAALLTLAAMQAPPPDGGKAAAIAPVLGEEVSVVAHLDLVRLDVPAALKRLLGELGDDQAIAGVSGVASGWVDSLKRAGAKDLFVLFDLADMPGMPTVAVPLPAGADGKAIAGVLCGPGPLKWPDCATIRGVAVAGNPGALARIRETQPASRPELAAALEASGDAAIRIALIPTTTLRRALEESIPSLPADLRGTPVTTITRDLSWAGFAMAIEPKPVLRSVVQAKDGDAAKSLAKLIQDSLGLLARQLKEQPGTGELAAAMGRITPAVQANRVTLEADLEKAAALAAMPIKNARDRAVRAQCVNNLKQLALAMHNYHSRYNTFPPAFKARDGKPLLSWRVHILPFLEQKDLYDAFHLDEPWDSPHNRALISRMPKVFACPKSPPALAALGKTTYLTPRGPATIFPGEQAVKIQDITDGTSNTILVVDVPDNAAVVWTSPSDWDVAQEPPARAMLGHHSGGTSVAFADGSVRYLRTTIVPRVLRMLLTRNGGEVISPDDF